MNATMDNPQLSAADWRDNHPRKRIAVLDSEMSYIDTGSGEPLVFLHGNPTSSYLWRNVISPLQSNYRCLAPDLIGMGKSGKNPSGDFSFLQHARYLDAWFDQMGFDKVVLVLHDWGSALGFYWAYRNEEKVKAIVYMEAIVQPKRWSDFPSGRDAIFRALRSDNGEEMVMEQNFFIETVLPKSILRTLRPEEMDAYREPFKTRESRLPTLQFPRMLPIEGTPEDIVKLVDTYGEWLSRSLVPKLLIVAEPGAFLKGRSLDFCRTWPNQQEIMVKGIHYVQEDSPLEIAEGIRNFLVRKNN